jgi:hypothetical protein
MLKGCGLRAAGGESRRAGGVVESGAASRVDHVEGEVAAAFRLADATMLVVVLAVAYFSGTDMKPARGAAAARRNHRNGWGQ